MGRFFFSIGFLFVSSLLRGQGLVSNDMYYMNWQTINPAAIDRLSYFNDAREPNWAFDVIWRPRWAGVEGSPTTKLVSVNHFFSADKQGYAHSKAGVLLHQDSIGGFNKTTALLNYTFKLTFANDDKLYIGFNSGAAWAKYTASNDPSSQIDPVVLNHAGYPRAVFFILTPGFVYYHDNGFYWGLSAPHVVDLSLQTPRNTKKNTNYFQNYNLTAGFYHPFGQDADRRILDNRTAWEISTLVQYNTQLGYTNFTQRLSGQVNYRLYMAWGSEKVDDQLHLWLGLGAHSSYSLSVEGGITFPVFDKGSLRLGGTSRLVRFRKETQISPTFFNNHEIQTTLTF